MSKCVLFRVKRPEGGRNFPLVDFFVYTGEQHNPWRCSTCATKKQTKTAEAVRDLDDIYQVFGGAPSCCRKCGTDFYR